MGLVGKHISLKENLCGENIRLALKQVGDVGIKVFLAVLHQRVGIFLVRKKAMSGFIGGERV